MSRISGCLAALAARQRKAVVPYIVAGDPGQSATVPTMHAMVAAGADIIELGVPFSDPMAEGPVIQLAHERALAAGTRLVDVLEMVASFRQRDAVTPVVLMGYANPIEIMGYDRFATLASEAGVDGLLTVDLPPEESGELTAVLRQVDIDTIYLIAPTTSAKRSEQICAAASGYIYYVSLKGVTGAGHLDVDEVKTQVDRIKTLTALPVCVGFGIKDGDSARSIARCADGVVVGSVLVNAMGAENEQAAVEAAVAKIIAEISAGANTAAE